MKAGSAISIVGIWAATAAIVYFAGGGLNVVPAVIAAAVATWGVACND